MSKEAIELLKFLQTAHPNKCISHDCSLRVSFSCLAQIHEAKILSHAPRIRTHTCRAIQLSLTYFAGERREQAAYGVLSLTTPLFDLKVLNGGKRWRSLTTAGC